MPTLQLLDSADVTSKFSKRCTYHKPDNYDSISAKSRDINWNFKQVSVLHNIYK